MSTRAERAPGPSGGGLSVTTLAIASVSSIAAAVFIHKFWTGGAILGAGITPIIVAVVSEALKRPTQAISRVRPAASDPQPYERTAEQAVAPDPGAPAPREDKFGIWEADQPEKQSGLHWHRLRGRPLKLALATGALAFAIGAFALTGADLVFGGSGGGGDRFIVLPGKQQKSEDDADKTKTTTTKTQTETVTETETVPAPEEQTETVPETPQQTVPTTPPTVPTQPAVPNTETVPPDQTVPPTATQPAG